MDFNNNLRIKKISWVLLTFGILLVPLVVLDFSFRIFMNEQPISLFAYLGLFIVVVLFVKFTIFPTLEYFHNIICPKCSSKNTYYFGSKNEIAKSKSGLRVYNITISHAELKCGDCGAIFELNKKPLYVKFFQNIGFSAGGDKSSDGKGFGKGSSGGGGSSGGF